jgi:hypothetical protein
VPRLLCLPGLGFSVSTGSATPVPATALGDCLVRARAPAQTHAHTNASAHTGRPCLNTNPETLNPNPKKPTPQTPHIPPDPPPHGMAQTSRRNSSGCRAISRRDSIPCCEVSIINLRCTCSPMVTVEVSLAEAAGGGAPNGLHGHKRANKNTAAAVVRCAPPPVYLARGSKVSPRSSLPDI